MVVFAVGMGRRMMGSVSDPSNVGYARFELGSWCTGSNGMDQPTSRQGRLVTP